MIIHGITAIKDGQLVTGDFPRTFNTIEIRERNAPRSTPAICFDVVKDEVFFSTRNGAYFWKKDFTPTEIFQHTHIKNVRLYPYSFQKEYEAIKHNVLFRGKQTCKYNYSFFGANDIPYTFGLEFETSSGCIPEPLCFRDGLIPLRDGSINGPEYSTVVLQKKSGVNLLYQQLETLRRYTHFNKECALHIHLGGYPLDPAYVFTLYSLCYFLEGDFIKMTNRDVFDTGRYKATGKNYCSSLCECSTFDEMFETITGVHYAGSMTAPHQDDPDRSQKWRIHSRYKCVNFVNMLCYKTPKTVEFRFLRPTYNFTKIYTWLLLFSAIMQFAEKWTAKFGACSYEDLREKAVQHNLQYDIRSIVNDIYSKPLADYLNDRITELQTISVLQRANCDFSGSDTSFENELMIAPFRE